MKNAENGLFDAEINDNRKFLIQKMSDRILYRKEERGPGTRNTLVNPSLLKIRKATDYCVLIERVRALDNLPIWEIQERVKDGSIYSYTDIKSMRKGRKKLLNMVLIATGEREFGGTIDMDVLKLIATGRINEAKKMSARAFSFWVHVLEDKGIVDTRVGFIDEKMIEMIIKKKRVLRKKELAATGVHSGSLMRSSVRMASIGRY